ncbi:MAG TPA: C39 family peptidase [Candidatus Binatia bacterium]|jgi:hypothetical protein|nr:C39 family peptidase [Candidatus Binatia bacterium]
MRRTPVIISAIAIVALGAAAFAYRGELRDAYGRWQRGPIPPAVTRQEALKQEPPAPPAPAPEPGPAPVVNRPKPAPAPAPAPSPSPSVPASINLKVLFVPQAPFKVWDALHEDACEEAAMTMLQAYAEGTDTMSLEEMDRRLKDLVAYETEKYGDVPSISAERAAEVMRDHLHVKARAVAIGSLDDIRAEIAAGHPVILPAAGRLLYNPNFRDGGPLYHMLVAKGYTAKSIITNDAGTRVGADYAYANDLIWNAVHDWNDGDVYHGAKMMIVLEE